MLKGRRGSKAVTPSQGVPRGGGGGGGGGSSGSGGGGGQAFDPRLIFTQIAALQSFHYAFLSLFLQFSSVLFGRRPATLDAVFASGGLELWSSDAASVLAAGAAGAFLLAVIVEKSKKCLDFAATLFLLHLLACTLYPGGGGVPTNLGWWVANLGGTLVMVVLGEYLCSLREMNEIPLLPLPSL